MKTILALDLGSKTGFAYSFEGSLNAGTWTLASDAELRYAKKLRCDRTLDIRVRKLIFRLQSLRSMLRAANGSIDLIVFEDVRFASSQAQAHLWGSFRGAVWAFASANGIDTDCLDTGKLKIHATGHGGATKEAMRRAWYKKYPLSLVNGIVADSQDLGDDAIDALHLLDWSLQFNA